MWCRGLAQRAADTRPRLLVRGCFPIVGFLHCISGLSRESILASRSFAPVLTGWRQARNPVGVEVSHYEQSKRLTPTSSGYRGRRAGRRGASPRGGACEQEGSRRPAAASRRRGRARSIQKDVPVFEEWIGSLDGFVNAEIRPQIEGYVLRQTYKRGLRRPGRRDPLRDRPAAVPGDLRPGQGHARPVRGDARQREDDGGALPTAGGARRRSASRSSTTPKRGSARRRPTWRPRGRASRRRSSTSAGRRSSRRSTASRASRSLRSATSSTARPS